MFFTIASCAIAPHPKDSSLRVAHYCALAADLVAGIGLIVLAILSAQNGLFAVNVQCALVGAGAAYVGGLLSVILFMVKKQLAPDSYLMRCE